MDAWEPTQQTLNVRKTVGGREHLPKIGPLRPFAHERPQRRFNAIVDPNAVLAELVEQTIGHAAVRDRRLRE